MAVGQKQQNNSVRHKNSAQYIRLIDSKGRSTSFVVGLFSLSATADKYPNKLTDKKLNQKKFVMLEMADTVGAPCS